VSGFESGELPSSSSLVPVLSRLLEFTPADLRNVRAARRKSWLDGLPALPSPATFGMSSGLAAPPEVLSSRKVSSGTGFAVPRT
jgi:hypothetical protein